MKETMHYEYKRRQIEGVEQGKLIIMLYDGAIKFLNFAKEAIDKKDYETAHNNLTRSQALINELMNSLKIEVGDIAVNLLRLYEFMYRQLCTANARKDKLIISGVIELLTSLKEGWISVIIKLKQEAREEKGNSEKEEGKKEKKAPIDIAI